MELIATASDHPAFALDYLAADRRYRRFDSHDARNVSVRCSDSDGEQTLTAAFSNLGGQDLDVTLTAHASEQARLSRWSIAVKNGAGLQIVNVQFPFVVVPFDAKGSLLLPEESGRLRTASCSTNNPRTIPGIGETRISIIQVSCSPNSWHGTPSAAACIWPAKTPKRISRFSKR